MGQISTYGRNKLLDHVYNTAYTPAATLYLALATADPTAAGTGASMNEVANSGSYARVAITFGAAASRLITQNANAAFAQLTGSLGTATHWGIVDTATYGAGNMLASGAFAAGKVLVSGNTPTVASGEVYVQFAANETSNYLANKWLDFMFRNQAFTRPTVYFGLVTATIADTDTGSTVTEPGNGYTRTVIDVNGGSTPTWELAASAVVANADAVTIGPATGGTWSTVVGTFTADASSAGNLLNYDNDMGDQAVGEGDSVSFPAGDITITLT